MSDKTIALTRRRALAALGTIGVGGAAAGAGTFAAFSDEETANGELTAGSLDLTQGDTPLSFSASNIKPGDTGSDYVTLSKATSSTIAGNLSVEVTSVVSDESASPDGTDDGNLADQVELTLWLDAGDGSSGSPDGTVNGDDVGLNSDGTITSSASKGTAAYATDFSSGAVWDTGDTNSPGFFTDFSGPVRFYVEWEFVDDSSESFNNNDAMGDDLTVDFAFTLTQQ